MQSSAVMKFELLKMLLITPQYLASITQNTDSQTLFLNTLKINKYTPEELLELINITPDNQIKSLLITQLLSIKSYLDRLMEQSVIDRLTNNALPIPSRLNPLVHQLSIEQLTLDQIKDLQPEAAVSILCSIPHFHLLKKDQVDALIGQYPKPSLVHYWINNYSLMPNAVFILAHLSRLVDWHVLSTIQQMDIQKQEHLIERVVDHLDLFTPGFKVLYEGDKEKHLIQAINLYLNGKQHPHYIIYIRQLAGILLTQNHPLALETIQLILSLNGIKEFSELTSQTGDLTNYYLRTQAQAGDTELFYNSGLLNSNRMNLLIQLKRPLPVKTEERGFLHNWLYPEKSNEPQAQTDKNNVPENSLIQQLAKQGKSVKAIDYYLLHFNGNSKTISKLIQDYLGYYLQEGCTESRRRSLYLTAIFINRPELKRSVREALYNSFLLFPELYDEQIRGWLFKYDAERTIKHFGQQAGVKNYKLVIELCTEVLKKLDPTKDEAKIKIANQALSEAKLELEFSENSGFFAQLFHRFIRCWKSGWTGFFSPKLPVYVAPFYTQSKEEQSTRHLPSMDAIKKQEKPEVSLTQTLTALETKRTLQELDKLIETLGVVPLIIPTHEALSLRNRINNLFHLLILDSKQNKAIESWLVKNLPFFNSNQFHLLELRLLQGARMDIDLLVKQIQEDANGLELSKESSHLQSTITELKSILPGLHSEINQPEEKALVTSEEPITLEKMTDMVTNAWNWAKGGVGSFFADTATTTARSSEQTVASSSPVQTNMS
jgi:hypothetical protein